MNRVDAAIAAWAMQPTTREWVREWVSLHHPEALVREPRGRESVGDRFRLWVRSRVVAK